MRKSLTVLALAGASVMIAGSAVAAQPVHAQMNNPAYWGDDCEKVEFEDGVYEYVIENGARLVIVKAGQAHDNWGSVGVGDTVYALSGKAISHVIVCGEYGGGGGGGGGS